MSICQSAFVNKNRILTFKLVARGSSTIFAEYPFTEPPRRLITTERDGSILPTHARDARPCKCQTLDKVAESGETNSTQITIRDFFAEDVSREDLIARFAKLRVPRHLFRFLYRLLTEHCNRATEDQPSWKISLRTLETITDTYSRELEAFDRGLGTG